MKGEYGKAKKGYSVSSKPRAGAYATPAPTKEEKRNRTLI
jgi:hypothetical protein